MDIYEKIKKYQDDTKAWFDAAFAGHDIPSDIRRVSERICMSYGIRGICDPMYIANIIALELGRGDGKGNFTKSIN